MIGFRNHDTPYGSFAGRLPYGVHWAPSVHRLRSKKFCTVFEVEGYDAILTDRLEAAKRTQVIRECMDRLGERFWFEAHSVRNEVASYLDVPDTRNRTLHVLDAEHRALFERRGVFYQTRTYIALGMRPEAAASKYLERVILGARLKDEEAGDEHDFDAFESAARDFGAALATGYRNVRRLGSEIDSDELGTPFVRDHIAGLADEFITGNRGPLSFQVDQPPLINGVIGGVDVVSGDFPEVNGFYHACVSIDGFPPWSIAGIADFLSMLPVESRWWSRYRPVSRSAALFRINRRRIGALTRAGTTVKDENPLAMTTARALSMAYGQASEGGMSFGWYDGGVVLRGRSLEAVEQAGNDLVELLRNKHGFAARVERRVAFRSLLSSYLFNEDFATWPCFMSGANLTHLFPLASPWIGTPVHPSPKFRELGISRPTRVAVGRGNTPVYVAPWLEDVGTRAMIGPQGTGKSTAIKALMVGEMLSDPRQLIVQLDSDYSSYLLCKAVGGIHVDLSGEKLPPMLCPGAMVDRGMAARDRFFAWCDDSFALQLGRPLSLEETADLRLAIDTFASNPRGTRSLTRLRTLLKERSLWDALDAIALENGDSGLLDAGESQLPSRDQLAMGGAQLLTIEIGTLAGSPRVMIPRLMAIFDYVEWLLNGDPLDMVADEVHKLFREGRYAHRFDRFGRELRKKNGWLTTASQYAADYATGDLAALLGQATKTWMWLPNPDPNEPEIEQFLTQKERELRANLIPKRHVMQKNALGTLPFSFELGPRELALIGRENVRDIAAFREIENIVKAKNREEGCSPGDSGFRDLTVPMWFEHLGFEGWQDAAAEWMQGDRSWPSALPLRPLAVREALPI